MIFKKKEKAVESKSRKIKKRLFRCTVLAMAIIMACGGCLSITASATTTKDSYYYTQKAFWPWEQDVKYKVYVYDNPSFFCIYYGNSFVSTGFDYKKNTDLVLSQTCDFSIAVQTKYSMNSGVDFSSFGVPVNIGSSIEASLAASWKISNEKKRTINRSDPTGYYSYNVCLDTTRIKLSKYTTGKNPKYVDSVVYYAPRAENTYRAIVFNPNEAEYDGAVKF